MDEPYHYVWTPTDPATNQTVQSMTDTITENTIVFHFYDTKNISQVITSYTVVCKQYASDHDLETLKPDVQRLFEKDKETGGVYGENALYISNGESTFYPLMGSRLYLTVKDIKGEDHIIIIINITIPPIPLKYLFLHHTDMMTYHTETDLLSNKNSDLHIQSHEKVKALVTYYTFGGDAIGTGIQLSFQIAEGKYKGSNILYHPFIDGQRSNASDYETAPFIGIPMLLNTDSALFEQLSKNQNFWIYVQEKGDGESGFRPERLLLEPEMNTRNGVVYIQMNHLTAVGLGTGEMPSSIEPQNKEDCLDCEKSVNCFLELIMEW